MHSPLLYVVVALTDLIIQQLQMKAEFRGSLILNIKMYSIYVSVINIHNF